MPESRNAAAPACALVWLLSGCGSRAEWRWASRSDRSRRELLRGDGGLPARNAARAAQSEAGGRPPETSDAFRGGVTGCFGHPTVRNIHVASTRPRPRPPRPGLCAWLPGLRHLPPTRINCCPERGASRPLAVPGVRHSFSLEGTGGLTCTCSRSVPVPVTQRPLTLAPYDLVTRLLVRNAPQRHSGPVLPS